MNPTPIPGGKWWSGVDSDSESRQNGVDSGFGVDSTGINYKSGTDGPRMTSYFTVNTIMNRINSSSLKCILQSDDEVCGGGVHATPLIVPLHVGSLWCVDAALCPDYAVTGPRRPCGESIYSLHRQPSRSAWRL